MISADAAPGPGELPAGSALPPEPERVFFGRAVDHGRLRFVSVSQVKAFDPEEEGGCPRRWYYRYVMGFKEPEADPHKAGKAFARELEHYLKTGRDALSPILRAAKHLFPRPGADLEVEQKLGDMPRAVRAREALLARGGAEAAEVARELERAAGLTAADVPFDGAADFRHRRGEYVDADGVIRPEAAGLVVAEIGDLKSTSRINNYVSSGGKFYPGYAKTVEQVLNDTQMLGYGVHASRIYADLTHVRLSLIYCQKKHGFAASKRTGLISVEEVRARWRRVEDVVRDMERVAALPDPNAAPANTRSCNAYQRVCAHAPYCYRPERSIVDLLQITKGDVAMSMGLFEQLTVTGTNGVAPTPPSLPQGLFDAGAPPAPPIPMPPAPPVPQMSDQDRAAAIEAEKRRLLAEERPRHPLEGLEGYTVGQPCNGHGYYASENGVGHVTVERGHSCSACATPMPAVPPIGAINPLDAPPFDPVTAAQPLEQAVIDAIPDPALRAKAQAHRDAATTRALQAAKPQQTDEAKTGGRCLGGKADRFYPVSDKEKVTRRKNCPECGKEMRIRDADFSADFSQVKLGGHNRVGAPPAAPPLPPVAAAAPPLPAAAPPLPPPAPEPPIAVIAVPAAPAVASVDTTAQAASGIVLYVDVVFERGAAPASLEPWYEDIVHSIERAYSVDDIRVAPDKSELGFGRWRGWLAATCKKNAPPPGEYFLRVGSNEIAQVVVEALVPMCKRVVRGVVR